MAVLTKYEYVPVVVKLLYRVYRPFHEGEHNADEFVTRSDLIGKAYWYVKNVTLSDLMDETSVRSQ